jgi:hypothetical protein
MSVPAELVVVLASRFVLSRLFYITVSFDQIVGITRLWRLDEASCALHQPLPCLDCSCTSLFMQIIVEAACSLAWHLMTCNWLVVESSWQGVCIIYLVMHGTVDIHHSVFTCKSNFVVITIAKVTGHSSSTRIAGKCWLQALIPGSS